MPNRWDLVHHCQPDALTAERWRDFWGRLEHLGWTPRGSDFPRSAFFRSPTHPRERSLPVEDPVAFFQRSIEQGLGTLPISHDTWSHPSDPTDIQVGRLPGLGAWVAIRRLRAPQLGSSEEENRPVLERSRILMRAGAETLRPDLITPANDWSWERALHTSPLDSRYGGFLLWLTSPTFASEPGWEVLAPHLESHVVARAPMANGYELWFASTLETRKWVVLSPSTTHVVEIPGS